MNLANFLANLAVVSFGPVGIHAITSTVFKAQQYGERPLSTFRGVERSITRTTEYIHTRVSFDANIPRNESGYIHTRSQITTGPESGLEIENKSLSYGASFLLAGYIRVGLFPGGVVL